MDREEFDWEGDRPLEIPYEDTVIYRLHVRGFTRHSSSGTEEHGTFSAIAEKIPYLKDLGVTAVELLPPGTEVEVILVSGSGNSEKSRAKVRLQIKKTRLYAHGAA